MLAFQRLTERAASFQEPVPVHEFVCRGTVEERIDALIEDKMALALDLLEDSGEARLTEMGDDELLGVLALDVNRASI